MSSVSLPVLSSCLPVGELHSCFGIDIIPVSCTLLGKVVRINCCFEGEGASFLDTLKSLFSYNEALIIGPRELVGVIKDGE